MTSCSSSQMWVFFLVNTGTYCDYLRCKAICRHHGNTMTFSESQLIFYKRHRLEFIRIENQSNYNSFFPPTFSKRFLTQKISINDMQTNLLNKHTSSSTWTHWKSHHSIIKIFIMDNVCTASARVYHSSRRGESEPEMNKKIQWSCRDFPGEKWAWAVADSGQAGHLWACRQNQDTWGGLIWVTEPKQLKSVKLLCILWWKLQVRKWRMTNWCLSLAMCKDANYIKSHNIQQKQHFKEN